MYHLSTTADHDQSRVSYRLVCRPESEEGGDEEPEEALHEEEHEAPEAESFDPRSDVHDLLSSNINILTLRTKIDDPGSVFFLINASRGFLPELADCFAAAQAR